MKSRKRRFNQVPDTEDDWSDSLDEYSWDDDEVQIVRAQSIEQGRTSKKAKAEDETPENVKTTWK